MEHISRRTVKSDIWYIRGAISTLLLPFIAVLIFYAVSGIPDLARSGDGALLEISTRNTASLRTLTGPYSRYEFHHPGPAYFFAQIPLYYLSGRSASAAYLTVSFICILSIVGIILILLRHAPRMMLLIFCLLAALLLRYLKPVIWLNDWNPFIIIFPALLTFVSFAAVAAGFHKYLVISVVAGSFSVQTHIGCFPSIAAAAVFAGAFMVFRGKSKEGSIQPGNGSIKKSLLVAAGAAIILWIPVLLNEIISGSAGNLHRIFQFFSEMPPELSLRRTLFVWIDAVSGMDGIFLNGEHLRRMGILFQVKAVIVFIRIVLLFVSCYLLRKKKGSGFLLVTGEMALLIHLTTFISVMQIRGEPYSYLLIWFASVGLLSWMVIITSMVSLFNFYRHGMVRQWTIRIGTGLVVTLSILNTVSIWNAPMENPLDPLSYNDEHVKVLSDSLSCYLSTQDPRSWVIVPVEHDLWPLMTGIVNLLDKDGWDVFVAADYAFMTGVQPNIEAVPIYLVSDSCGISHEGEVLFSCGNIQVRR